MIITVAGMPGAGKSTLAKKIAVELHLKHYYMGQIMRDAAGKKGMDILSYLKFLESHPEEERNHDAFIEEKGKTEDNFIIEGRVAYHFIPQSIKLFLEVDPKVGAERIFNDIKTNPKRNEKNYQSVKEVEIYLEGIQETCNKRYQSLYSINPFDSSQFDIVVDTTDLSEGEAFAAVLEEIKKFKQSSYN
jgi:CMP/dCMP kinase